MIVYLATNLVNNKYYVGWTSKTLAIRWKDHCSEYKSSQHFSRAIRKHGKDSFSLQILGNVITQEEAKNLERLWIGCLLSYLPQFGYNMTFGGDGVSGLVRSAETKALYSIAKKGIPKTAAHKANLSRVNKGKPSGMKGKNLKR